MSRQVRRLTTVAAAVACLILLGCRAWAANPTEDEVKAAYLYNFAKFIEWPAQDFASAGAPIRVCVLNDGELQRELERIVRDKQAAGRNLMVSAVETAEEARACQMVYIGHAQRSPGQLTQALRGRRVVTVGDSGGFVQGGGTIEFVLEENRVRFEINHRAATQAGLRISSRLLAVARLVIE
jgi:hypothetical protein